MMKITCYVLRRWMFVVILLLCGTIVLTSCKKEEELPQPTNTKIKYHCATLTEGQQLMLANTDYYNSLTQVDIDWRMRRTGATLNEIMDFARSCVRDFTDEDKAAIAKAVAFIERKLHEDIPLYED